MIEETGNQDAIDDKHNVVTNQHRAHEIIGMAVEEIDKTGG